MDKRFPPDSGMIWSIMHFIL